MYGAERMKKSERCRQQMNFTRISKLSGIIAGSRRLRKRWGDLLCKGLSIIMKQAVNIIYDVLSSNCLCTLKCLSNVWCYSFSVILIFL